MTISNNPNGFFSSLSILSFSAICFQASADSSNDSLTGISSYAYVSSQTATFPGQRKEHDYIRPGAHQPKFWKGEEHINEFFDDQLPGFRKRSCRKATKKQKKALRQSQKSFDKFIQDCLKTTESKNYCHQITRPNPNSRHTFTCTYGESMPHIMIHPNKKTWKNAFRAIRLIKELESRGIDVCAINNWWRPEPYNQNVSGSPTRHPHGHSVDVLFCSKRDQSRAFRYLCKQRKKGRIRAIGYYSSSILHLGISDRRGNTWGRKCPK